jgi:ATP-binding cassette, subfamily C, bacterial PrsD
MPGSALRRSELSSVLFAARHAFYGIGLFSAIINILAITGSMYMLEVYDRVLPSRSVPTLVALSILTGALFSFYGLLEALRSRVLVRIGASVDAALSPRVYRAIVRLPLSQGRLGEGALPLRDLDAVRSFLSSPAPSVLFDLPWVPLYLGVIYLFHPLLALLALLGMIPLILVMLLTEGLTRGPTSAASEHAAERQRLAEASRRNAEALTAMGMFGWFGERWAKANDLYMASQQRASDVAGGFGALARVLRMALQSAVLGLGAYLVIRQEATAGVIIAGSILAARALAPLDFAIPHWKGWMSARQSWKRLSQILQLFPEPGALLRLPVPSHQLSVEAASVAPPGGNTLVVQDATFTVTSGQGLGIIGPSASGKSSLARMLVGVWKPARGNIRIDGAALDQWAPEELGRHIGYLPQVVELLPGTIAENIARFDPAAEREAIIRAAQAAGVHDLIVNLPNGYQTIIGEQGAGLSAGQQQRVALARALYGDPFLVVLDEPNSNLDIEGEAALTRAIVGVRERGGIAIIIAHHPSALAGVDGLLVMGRGRVQGFGPKDAILAQVLRPAISAPPPLKIVSDTSGAGP